MAKTANRILSGTPPTPVAMMNTEMKVKIKNRKVELFQIAVPMIGKTLRIIHVTPKQLEKLNALPVGKEVFLSHYYCQIGGDFWGPTTAFNMYRTPTAYRIVTRISWIRSFVNRIIKPTLKTKGIAWKRSGLYCGRRGACTEAIEKTNGNYAIAQALLRHKHMTTTLKVYKKQITPDAFKAGMKMLEAAATKK